MEEGNSSSWVTKSSKSAKGGKPAQDTRFPVIALGETTLSSLNQIFVYTAALKEMFRGSHGEDEAFELLKKDPELQYAAIFCFKAIGACLEKAEKTLGKGCPIFPLFWENLLYLRTALVHHILDMKLPDDSLRLLAKIVKNSGQIFFYFDTICRECKTNVELSQKFGVFMDVAELTEDLRDIKYTRQVRDEKKQDAYVALIFKLISILASIAKDTDITEEGLSALRTKNPRKYYAIQNFLEFIATLANPSPEFSVLTEKSRKKIVGIHENADTWFRALGESRNDAMHGGKCLIPDWDTIVHLKNLHELNLKLALQSQQKKGAAPSLAPPPDSPSKVIKSLGIQPKSPAKNPKKEVAPKNVPEKSVTITQPKTQPKSVAAKGGWEVVGKSPAQSSKKGPK